ncbi:MAG: AAA family ATPase [Clostridia bacterium]
MKIHIIGAAGSGTSSIGKYIASKHNYKQIESDYYAWKLTDPPFSEYRDAKESQALLKEVFEAYENLVLCGSIAKWGQEFAREFDLVIFLKAPTRVRVKRLKEREFFLHGNRVLPSGDMHDNFVNFLWYAKHYNRGDLSFRSLALHKKFIKDFISCPVLKVNTNKNFKKIYSKIDKTIAKIDKMLKNI